MISRFRWAENDPPHNTDVGLLRLGEAILSRETMMSTPQGKRGRASPKSSANTVCNERCELSYCLCVSGVSIGDCESRTTSLDPTTTPKFTVLRKLFLLSHRVTHGS